MLWASRLVVGIRGVVLSNGENWTGLGGLGLGIRVNGCTQHGETVLGSKRHRLRYR